MANPEVTTVEFKTGYVLFLPFAEGPKSASVRPFLVVADGKTYRMVDPGSNPFSNDTLRKFHRAFCEVHGQFDAAKEIVTVTEIKETDEPENKDGTPEQNDRGAPEAPH